MSKGILKEIKIGGGLQPTPQDERDFSLGAIFSIPKLEDIDKTFSLIDLKVKDQKDSDFCTCYAGTYASEIQEGIELSPEWQFSKTKELSGNWQEWGANLRQMLKSLTKSGSRKQSDIPQEFIYNGNNRDIIANMENWPDDLKNGDLKLRKSSFFKISGPYDLFDNIRATLWDSKIKYEKSGNKSDLKIIITGAIWKHAWTVAEGGIVPSQQFQGGFGHAFVLTGVKEIDNELFIEATLSNGVDIGDRGKFYFNRETINRELLWGAYTLRDIEPELAKILIEKEWSVSMSGFAKIIMFFKKLLKLYDLS